MIEGNGGLPQGRTQVRTYSDYCWAAREAKKEDSIELTWNSRIQASDGLSKPGPLASSP